MLKVLHTADWHLGHQLHGVSRQLEHQQFLHWLLTQLNRQAVDVLIIAGDIFDSANPSALAQTQFYEFLVSAKQQQPHLTVILIAGNHDSASRLQAPASLLNTLNIHVIGGLPYSEQTILWDKLIIPLTDQQGVIRGWCGAMPFLRHADLPTCTQNSEDPFVDGVQARYQQLTSALTQRAAEDHALILTGHGYVVGGELSELSERRLLGGKQQALPTAIFADEIDYVALGHLHKPQALGSRSQIRYSGSPLPLSFDEMDYKHQVLFIQFTGKHSDIQPLLVPRSIELIRLPNGKEYAPLTELLMQLQTLQLDYRLDESRYPFVELRILLDKPEPSLHQQIDSAIVDLPLRVLKRSLAYAGQGQSLAEQVMEQRLEELQPLAVFEHCYRQRYGNEPDAALLALFQQLVVQVQTKD